MTKINKYLNKKYINNYSEIKSYSKDNEFKYIISNLDENIYINVTSNLIHKTKQINQIEQFIFNLDNYITFIKQFIQINPLELKYIINLTIYNKNNKILYSNLYYYSNIEKYNNEFKKIFMYNYYKNINKLRKTFVIEKRNFVKLANHINRKQKKTYCYFENITNNNMYFYIPIIQYLEDITLKKHQE